MGRIRPALESVAIVGDGQVALLVAIALRRSLPQCRIEIVGVAGELTGVADIACTALPFTNRLHDRLGLTEDMMVHKAKATHRLVTRYVDWAGPGSQGSAAYGAALPVQLQTAFARHWGGTAQRGEAGVGALSLGEALAQAGRFAPPNGSESGVLAELDYALRWDRTAYMELLIRMAAGLGIKRQSASFAGQILSRDGVASIRLHDGSGLCADLYLDCSGPSRRLIRSLDGYVVVDWSDRLPVRRLAIARGNRGRLSLADRIGMTKAGWVAQTEGTAGQEAVLALARGRDDDAAQALFGPTKLDFLDLSPVRLREAWVGNVIALGDAACVVEPLGWTNLDLAHRAIDLLLEMLPGRPAHPPERQEFNRRFALMADSTCDFVASHYAAPAASIFYNLARQSPELVRAFEQFLRRGKLPFVEDAPLAGREWHGILCALGMSPGSDALNLAAEPDEQRRTLAAHQQALVQAVQAVPPYEQWYRSVAEL